MKMFHNIEIKKKIHNITRIDSYGNIIDKEKREHKVLLY